MRQQKYKVTERVQTKYLYMKDFDKGDMILENPSEYVDYTEKDMVSKKGKKFVAKNYLFKDTETGERLGVAHTGLLGYLMADYKKGDVLQLRYDGKDEEDRHQLTIFECSLGEDEVDPSKVLEAQEKIEVSEEEDYDL